MTVALVRALSDGYADATRGALGDPALDGPIDVALARSQHAAYVAGLEALGFAVQTLPAGGPDACFVEDQAVVVGARALLCRTGHPGRRAEAGAVREALEALGLTVVCMGEGDGVLEGGDVLRVGGRLYVGRSSRTDGRGIACLQRNFPELEVVPVDLPAGVLHLKCVCSSPAPDLVLLAEGALAPTTFAGTVRQVPASEAYAANAVGHGGRVLVAGGYPRTAELLRAEGLDVFPLELSEIRKGDGSLTCLSLLLTG